MGSGALFFGLILVPNIASQARVLDHWATPTIVCIVFAPFLALLPASYVKDLGYVRRLGASCGWCWLLGAVVWLTAANGEHISAQQDVWLSTFPAIAAMATAFAWPLWATLVYLICSSVLAQVLHFFTRPPEAVWRIVPESLYITAFCSLFVLATVVALRTGSLLDDAVSAARERASSNARADARDIERRRFDSFIHDKVMSTLLALAREGSTRELSERARKTLEEVRDLNRSHVADSGLPAAAAVTLVRDAVNAVSTTVAIHGVREGLRSEGTVPARAAHALAAAAAEAVQNSLQHAGFSDGSVGRLVALKSEDGYLQIVIADNGRGFDTASIAPDRLGVASTILGGVNSLAGCSAIVDSQTGRGTVVTLRYDS